METSILGKTGLRVKRLGLGLVGVGRTLTQADIDNSGRVLNSALDGGINFLDTSPCYADSEEVVGRTISHRRQEFILATKCGHVRRDATGTAWSAETIANSIDGSLRRLRTDHLDLVQLHSCDVEILERGEAIEALLGAQRAGKTRFVGYSGDNEDAEWVVESGLFDTLQTSFSVVDQRPRNGLLGRAKAAGMGVIAKRPVANGAWGRASSPSAYAEPYWRRGQTMAGMGPIQGEPDDPVVLALGFVFAHPEVDTAIAGTASPLHLLSNIKLVEEQLPIPAEVVEELHRRFDECDDEWVQLE